MADASTLAALRIHDRSDRQHTGRKPLARVGIGHGRGALPDDQGVLV